jgi:ribosomal-protein-alanine N-acetyltransferase
VTGRRIAGHDYGKDSDMGTAVLRAPERVRIHIRWMIRRDLADVMRIERDCFDHAWADEDFLRCLRQRNCIGMVAEQGDRVVGFMIYELHKQRLNLLNFAVSPSVRRTGIGRLMITKLISKLSSHRRSRISLTVREGNLPAQLFFRSHEFLASKVLKNHYEDSGEDAFLMEYVVADEPAEESFKLVNRIAGYGP